MQIGWNILTFFLAVGAIIDYSREPMAIWMVILTFILINIIPLSNWIYYKIMMSYKPGLAINKKTNEWVITGNLGKYNRMKRNYYG
jgi:hypothetical protein